jgi:UDP-N-acetylglucosamine 3-dehydrogenase
MLIANIAVMSVSRETSNVMLMDPSKIGLFGFGFMGKTHAMNVKNNPDSRLNAVFSIESDRPAIEQLGASFYDDWHEMMAAEDFDAVIIATPTFTHAEITLAAINKGWHVFLEKPMERHLENCQLIIDAAEKRQVLLGMGHVLRFDDEYITFKEKVAAGIIGNPKMARCTRRGPPPGWSTWFFDEEKSGTVILDLTIHDLDYICWLAGTAPKRVTAIASSILLGNNNMFGISHVVLDFEPGTGIELGFAEASWGAKGSYPFSTSIEIAGTDGLITSQVPGKHPIEIYSDKDRTAMNLFSKDGYANEIDDFIASIRSGQQPKVSGADGMLAVKVCLAALESARTRETIDFEGFA